MMKHTVRSLMILLLAVLLTMGAFPSSASACINDNGHYGGTCIQSMPPVVTEDF